jgi:hypothetical protein
MSIKYVIGGVVAVGATTLVGGNLYADQQLKSFYQQEVKSADKKMINIKVNHLNMGALSGEADYILSIMPDPCQPQDKFDLHIKDKITRQLTGYKIDSTVVLPENIEKTLKPIFSGQAPVAMQSTLSWTGNIHVKASSPAIDYNKDNQYVQSKGIVLEFDTNKKDYQLMKDIHLDMPSLVVRNDSSYFALDKLNFEADHIHYKKILPKSSSALTLNQLKFNTYTEQRPIEVNVQQFKLSNQSEVKNQKFSNMNTFEIGKFKLPASEEFGKLAMNFDIKDIDAVKLQALLDELDKSGQECQATEQAQEKLMQAALQVLEQGIKFESKNNVITLGDKTLTANIEGTLPQGQYGTMMNFISAAPTKVSVTGQAESSKAFVKELMKLNPAMAAQADDRMVDEMLKQFQMQGMLKVEGDKLISKFEYQAGQPRFTN